MQAHEIQGLTKKGEKVLIFRTFSPFGGPEETRTLDLSDANRTLSQLSYRPKYWYFVMQTRWHRVSCVKSLELARLLSQLSYRPERLNIIAHISDL